MLSRQASSLYWLGRYQERAEYMARFLQVKYFSTMDTNLEDYKSFALRSIIFMCLGEAPTHLEEEESEILWNIAKNDASNTSILSYIKAVRTNTKGIRNLVSNELWEVVNKNYHFAEQFPSDYLKTRGLYEYTHAVLENASNFQAKLESTLLHDEVWAFIKLGIFVERAFQINRILINTMIDINALQGDSKNLALQNHQWLTTLNVLEASDMTRKIFKTSVHQSNASEFLITNVEFPRSIAFCMEEITMLIKKIKKSSDYDHMAKDSLVFQASKLASSIKFLEYSEIEKEMTPFLNNISKELFHLNNTISEEFF